MTLHSFVLPVQTACIYIRVVNRKKKMSDGITLLLLRNIHVYIILLFLFSFYLTGLSSHPLHRSCLNTFSFSHFFSLTYICTIFLRWWRPCTFAIILLLLLLFITRSSNEEKNDVKIEDDDYDYCLAWPKKLHHIYILYARTEIRWTLDITFRQIYHNSMIKHWIMSRITAIVVYQII